MDVSKLLSPSEEKDEPQVSKQFKAETRKNDLHNNLPYTRSNNQNAKPQDTFTEPYPRHQYITSNPAQNVNTSQAGYQPVTSAAVPQSTVHHHRSEANSSLKPRETDDRNQHKQVKRQKQRPHTERTLSSRSLTAATMDDPQTDMVSPQKLSSKTLPQDQLKRIEELLTQLEEQPWNHIWHTELINTLRHGFQIHVESGSDPTTYDLLPQLRQARQAMDSRFAVGESIWLGWLHDEMLLANSAETAMTVTELCQKAADEESNSVYIWQAYITWLTTMRSRSQFEDELSKWSTEDKQLCKEFFTQETILDIYKQAIDATKWQISNSHTIWDSFINILKETSAPVDEMEQIFVERLQVPHATMDDTMQLFWPIVSQKYGDNFEGVMSQITESMSSAKQQWKLREQHESRLTQAIEAQDRQEAYRVIENYLKWEKTHRKRSLYDFDLICALYERAILLFPYTPSWWTEYIDYVISQQPSTHNPTASLLPLIERATRHCPFQGELWTTRIVRADFEHRSHDEIEAIKHRATTSGMLDWNIESLTTMLIAWCSYLRRHAFSATSTQDDIDTAEVGILASIEDIQQAAVRTQRDADHLGMFELHCIQIKFLSEARRLDEARAVFESLKASRKELAAFWLQYYEFEIAIWAHHRANDALRVETTESGPTLATNVMENAIKQRNLDSPELISRNYQRHFQLHESVEKLQAASITVKDFDRRARERRLKEAEAAGTHRVMEHNADHTVSEASTSRLGDKRGREVEEEVAEPDASSKKARHEETSNGDTAQAQAKRDRERLTISLSNLPQDVTELEIRKFFRECGTVVSVNIANNDGTALVEFESQADVAAAKTRDGKYLRDNAVQIRSGVQATLYVANYPAEYDEAAIRKLFDAYGQIVSVRFPSLKYNNRRRFCYVSFLDGEQARSAQDAMDNKMLDGSHKLLAKIADPDNKKKRSGAQAEKREIHIKNLDFTVSENEVRTFFEQYGTVLSVRLLKTLSGRNNGTGFIVFETAEEASKAVKQADKKPFHDRVLNVALSTPQDATISAQDKAKKTNVIVNTSATPEPNDHHMHDASERRGSDVSMKSSTSHQPEADSYKTIRERQIAIFHLPDTVTDARVVAEMTKYGSVVKVQLRREQEAAIVEFADVKTAFLVREGVDCTSLGSDVKTGDVQDLFKKQSKAGGASNSALAFRPNAVGRPKAQRGGHRGGLGFKARAAPNAAEGGKNEQAVKTNGSGGTKGNAAFRAIFEAGKKADDQEEQ